MRHQSQVEAPTPHTPRTPDQLLDDAERLVGTGYSPRTMAWKLITGRHPRAIAIAVALTEEAIMRAESTSDSVTTHVQTLMRASELLGRAGEEARVVLVCQRALRLAPAHAYASFNATRALLNLDLLAEADAVLERALTDHPSNRDLLRLKAVLLRLRGQNEQAVTLLRQLLSSAPEKTTMWLNLSFALLALQRYREALEAAERATALTAPSEVADAWTNKGLALTQLGDDSGAIAAYRQALRAYVGQLQARAELVQLYKRHGQPFRAWREQHLFRLLHSIRQAQGRLATPQRLEELRLLDVSGLDPGEQAVR